VGQAIVWLAQRPTTGDGAMTTAYELAHGNQRLQALIEFALREGWQVRRTADGRLIFSKSGGATFYTGATANTAPVAVEGCHA